MVAARAVDLGHEVVGTVATQAVTDSRVHERVLDVRDRYAVRSLFGELSPEVVVHTAYRQDAWAVTALGAAHVALAAAGCGARLVHVSSDVVFSGAAVTYAEAAVPDPASPYGAAKAAAEVAVAAIAPDAVIARTSLIMGRPESPMERRVRDLLEGRAVGELFDDDVRCPVHVDDLASALLELAFSHASGVRHVAGPDAVSRLEIGRLIALRDAFDPAVLQAGSRRAAGIPGPLDVRLDGRWTQRQLATRLRGAREFLSAPGPALT